MKPDVRFVALLTGVAALMGSPALGAPMILNEYNAVKDANFLKNSASDPYFGQVAGNGGDWMELVVISDMLDVRGWQIETNQAGSLDALITLPSDPVFAALRSGTILTIAELVPTDLSYNPAANDWWINYQASFSAGDSTHSNFQVTIRDASSQVVFGPAGEGINPASGIGSDEVFKLEENPSALITPLSNYNDGSSSTFGAPNVWSKGTITQDFSALRSVVPEPASLLVLAGGLIGLARKARRTGRHRA
ncbi:MAG: PEP-CTERM sorting domain-containing protein [Armatimonadetes bacterium]|nr:PEP-CTERM sorting domain-containing protein [Armatimonadota bacterium]